MVRFFTTALLRTESYHITMVSHISRNLLHQLIEQLDSFSSTRKEEVARTITSRLCQERYFSLLMKDPLSTIQNILLDLIDLCDQTGTLNDEYKYHFYLNDRNIQDIWNGVVRDLDKDSLIFAVGY